jgi:ribosome recycling factor
MEDSKTSDILRNCDERMQKAIEALSRELASLRTGRARPALVEHMRVDYYGVPTPLGQIASISAPEARLLVIQPWDRSAVASIEKAILKSDLGLNPTNDGNIIRLAIPLLTEERRREMVRLVKKRVEEGRVEVRNLRRQALEALRKLERDHDISQDEYQRASEQLQELTDRSIDDANRIGQDKESELMET